MKSIERDTLRVAREQFVTSRTLAPNSGTLLLAAILTVFAAVRFGLFAGISGADDVSIASLSLDLLSNGPSLPFSHYSGRVGLIYPQALVFALFGVGEWQMAVIPFLSSLAGVLLAYLIGKHYAQEQVGLLAAFLLGIFPLDAYFSSVLMPDLPLGATMALAFYLLIKSERSQHLSLAVLAGLAWGWAYLIKVEAFFFVFVVAALWVTRQLSSRTLFVCAISVGAVVFIEHVIYYLVSGDMLLRLHLIAGTSGGKMVAEYNATQLWVFPKAWFLTPYYFGLHYYFLFLALLWLPLHKRHDTLPIVVWAAVFLLWLQFGGNPFSASYSAKSHLDRYCNMLNVPMAVLIAMTIYDLGERYGAQLQRIMVTLITLTAVLFIPFNQLSSERQAATKALLDIVQEQQLYPLHLDRTSWALAQIYLYDAAQKGELHNLQPHNFSTGETNSPDPIDIDGYVLINRGFVDYGYNRYRVRKIESSQFTDQFETYLVSSNPMNISSYWSAEFLEAMSSLIPISTVRMKIQETARGLLDGNDAVLLKRR